MTTSHPALSTPNGTFDLHSMRWNQCSKTRKQESGRFLRDDVNDTFALYHRKLCNTLQKYTNKRIILGTITRKFHCDATFSNELSRACK